MKMNFGEVLDITDLGKHAAAWVIRLGILLAGTVTATPDPKRKNFYEVEGGSTVYYIYTPPASRTIFLLASWRNVFPSGTEEGATESEADLVYVTTPVGKFSHEKFLSHTGADALSRADREI
jgi:hypothetical protein